MTVDVVIPTIVRPSLEALLDSLARAAPQFPGRIILIDDRRADAPVRNLTNVPERLRPRIELYRGSGRGPSAARNAGWRRSRADWICFLDDDVTVSIDWHAALLRDLATAAADAAASQASVHVPLPSDRAPTDWERNVAQLSAAAWITADMAYRREVLEKVGGFDERFRRAYREDSDLALRVLAAGYTIAQGTRRTVHPVRQSDGWTSVRMQAGNADDVLMYVAHGRDWRRKAQASTGAWPWHVATVTAAGMAIAGAVGWLALTARFAAERIAPGPRTALEISTMIGTSAVIPFAAVYYRLCGYASIRAWRRARSRD